MLDTKLLGATVLTTEGLKQTDLGIQNGKIVQIGDLHHVLANETHSLKGLHVLPGFIDTQVHFREPGLEHKEDLESGTRGAVLGGVTAVFEMPNTNPPTTSQSLLQEKIKRATGRAWCDFAFYIGATTENIPQLGQLESLPGVCGIKVFMGSSTGTLLVSKDSDLEKIMATTKRRMAIHAEDDFRLQERKKQIPPGATAEHHPVWRDERAALLAVQRIVAIAERYKHPIHILHVSSKQEMEFLKSHKAYASVETLPQYLVFSGPEIYRRLGTKAQMNPPIRSAEHQEAIWAAIRNGTVDVLATDHAPHTLEEKAKPYPESPSGMTGVQTLVPIMLNEVSQGRLSLERLSQLTCRNPARLFGLSCRGEIEVGNWADFTIVDLKAEQTIEDSWIASKCRWTPYHGMKVTGWPRGTMIRGHMVMWEGHLRGNPCGQPLEFK